MLLSEETGLVLTVAFTASGGETWSVLVKRTQCAKGSWELSIVQASCDGLTVTATAWMDRVGPDQVVDFWAQASSEFLMKLWGAQLAEA